MNHRSTPARLVALGGVFAAMAVILMSLGGLIPIATYVCPMLCALILQFVFLICGEQIAWAWYGAVSILSVLLSPDKEAAATFVFLGYYPIVKPKLERKRLPWLWKGMLFNGCIGIMYWILLEIIGMGQLAEDFEGIGLAMGAVMVLMGNIAFILLDRVLEKDIFQRIRNHG